MPGKTSSTTNSLSSHLANERLKSGIGSICVLMASLIFSASPFASARPTKASSSAIPHISLPPIPLAKALTLLHQLFGFFTSRACFLSYSVVSPTGWRMSSCSIHISLYTDQKEYFSFNSFHSQRAFSCGYSLSRYCCNSSSVILNTSFCFWNSYIST